MSDSPQPYRVLARKYRPQRFSELIGQDAMVQTLGNAIKRDRLAHAFLLTGVRGVGKTSTARLMAKALNCENGPTIDPCGACEPCTAIAEGRHIDVVEMDAASNTGVDDVREIIEAVRYAAVSARFKVYIIDEVHMLTKNAFNALLKTLEEPPPHVKFLFATTEIQKVPVTVLSRCQRFDLRRIPADLLAQHFGSVCQAEGVQIEAEALALIASAAEGSARDGLSILDQAIAHAGQDGAAAVSGAQVRDMLGLSDRGAVRRLFEAVLAGDAPGALAMLAEQHDLGVDPVAIFRALLEIVHGTTLSKVGGPADPSQSEEERAAYDGWSMGLSFSLLHRLWQMVMKGHDEVQRAADPRQAADMAVLRMIHASQLPDPAELVRKLEGPLCKVLPWRHPQMPFPPAMPRSLKRWKMAGTG
jgi:DNA polymerase III subunit gamma/tau